MQKFSLEDIATIRPLTLSLLSWLLIYPDILLETDIMRIKEALDSSILPIPSKTIPIRKDKRNDLNISKPKQLHELKVYTDYDYFKDSDKFCLFDFEIVQDISEADFLFLVSNIRDFYTVGNIYKDKDTTSTIMNAGNSKNDNNMMITNIDSTNNDTSSSLASSSSVIQRIQRVNQFPFEGGFVRKDLLLLTVRQYCYRDSYNTTTTTTTTTTDDSITTATTSGTKSVAAPSWWLPCYDLSTEFHLFVKEYQHRMNEWMRNHGIHRNRNNNHNNNHNNMWILKPATGTRALGHIIVASSDTRGLMKMAETAAKLTFVYEEEQENLNDDDVDDDDIDVNNNNGMNNSKNNTSNNNNYNNNHNSHPQEKITPIPPIKPISQDTNKKTIIGTQSASPPDRIAQLLITNPLLVLNRKFDLRVYVFVRSFVPFEAYMHECFYARLANEEYDVMKVEMNPEVALTVNAYVEDEDISNKQTRLNRRQLRFALEQEYEYQLLSRSASTKVKKEKEKEKEMMFLHMMKNDCDINDSSSINSNSNKNENGNGNNYQHHHSNNSNNNNTESNNNNNNNSNSNINNNNNNHNHRNNNNNRTKDSIPSSSFPSPSSSSFPWHALLDQVHTVCHELFHPSAVSIGSWPASSSYYGLDIMFENNYDDYGDSDNHHSNDYDDDDDDDDDGVDDDGNDDDDDNEKEEEEVQKEHDSIHSKSFNLNSSTTTTTTTTLSPKSTSSPPLFSAKLLEVNFCGDWSGIEDACNEKIDGVTGVQHYGHPHEPVFTYRDWVQDMMTCLGTDVSLDDHPRLRRL